MIYNLPALVTLLAVLLQFGAMFAVGHARGKYKVHAPATTGHPAFERAFRAQMNTLEACLMFLPTLWVAAHYGYVLWSGLAGLVWIVGRGWYVIGYIAEGRKRSPGYLIGMIAWAVTLVLAFMGLIRAILVT